MGKYEPLRIFLKAQNRERVPMTFPEIEKVIGAKLPNSKQFRAWWSNNPWNNVMTKEWLEAGYETESVDVEGEKLVFRKMPGKSATAFKYRARSEPQQEKHAGFKEEPINFRVERHMEDGNEEYIVPPQDADPLFGCMAGTLTLLPGIDYTAPADPDWGKVYDD